MSKLYHNDQAYVAEQFMFTDNHTNQLSQLTIHKINSLRLSAIHAAFCYNRQELYDLVKRSLLNYVTPYSILCKEGFFENGQDN